MGKTASRSIAIASAVLLLGVVLSFAISPVRGLGTPHHYLACQYSSYSEDSLYFREAITLAKRTEISPVPPIGHPVRLGIVSHHLLIKALIADYFQNLSREAHPATIVLIGPNHRNRGTDLIASSELPWKTPFGLVQPDLQLLKKMLQTQALKINEDAFYNEHSIGSLVPFIKAFFPDTRIVPLIIRADADTSEVLHLADWFADNLSGDALVIGSLDFSHYLKSLEAQREDDQTLSVIRGFREDRWRGTHVDSRKTLLLLLRYAERTESKTFDIVHHTNSGILFNSSNIPCTSYINCFFRATASNE